MKTACPWWHMICYVTCYLDMLLSENRNRQRKHLYNRSSITALEYGFVLLEQLNIKINYLYKNALILVYNNTGVNIGRSVQSRYISSVFIIKISKYLLQKFVKNMTNCCRHYIRHFLKKEKYHVTQKLT